jgi:hypothetical protein
MKHHRSDTLSAIAATATVLFVFLVGLLATPDSASALDLRQYCNKRCSLNKTLCTESTLPGGGGSGAGNCTNNCIDFYLECDAQCRNASDPTCGRNCNNALSTCTNSCSAGVAACNDAFVACRRSCEAVPQCTQDGHCSGGACVNGRCEAACRSNAQCQQRMGPDALCIAPTGSRVKRCMLM